MGTNSVGPRLASMSTYARARCFLNQLLIGSPSLCLILLVGIARPSGFPDGRGDFEGRETYQGREGRE